MFIYVIAQLSKNDKLNCSQGCKLKAMHLLLYDDTDLTFQDYD